MAGQAQRTRTTTRRLAAAAATAGALALPAAAFAHLERPSYWPDPAPDRSVSPPAGGEVPKARSLASAATGKGPGEVLVVCKGAEGQKSMRLLRKSVRRAKTKGYVLRPSQPNKVIKKKWAKKLLRINRRLANQCEYGSVQTAVFAAGNNDRVVIMPGRYPERKSRRAPVNDPKCAELTQRDSSGAETPSYRYQVTCPNDQNLVYIQGRKVPKQPPPEPPLEDRQGIPDLGPCVRCNLQIEGSGPSPDDVIIDAGKKYESNKVTAKPGKFAKDVILRADRADGIVIKNLLARGAREHGIYIEEVDGYRIDRAKMFWAADYGNLTFTSDHGLYKNCDGFGSGDAVLYPGAAPETGEQADKSFYPDAPRINTVIKKCDMHGSVLAYSGSMGNAVRITNNHIYGNTAGIATDSVSAAGHPGFPADSVEVDHNYIYSNNLDLFEANADVAPVVGVLPSGVGIFWPGHNNGRVHDNWIFDNWRWGTSLIAVPDALVEPEGNVNPGISCPNPELTTSCGNEYFDNHMGVVPKGFEPSSAVHWFGNKTGDYSRSRLPNGVDFWWDETETNTGNCWYDNTGVDGTAGSVTGPGPGTPPDILPSDCDSSMGTGDTAKRAYLVNCFLNREGEESFPCDWYDVPPQPGTEEARDQRQSFAHAARHFAGSDEALEIEERMDEITGIPDSSPPE